MKAICPHCTKDFEVQLEQHIPDEQKFAVRLTSESDLFNAKTIGEMIVNTTNLLQAVANEVGTPVGVCIHSFEQKPKEITIWFLITAIKGEPCNKLTASPQ